MCKNREEFWKEYSKLGEHERKKALKKYLGG